MGMKKECSCGYWNKEQEECLYSGTGCAKDEQEIKMEDEYYKKLEEEYRKSLTQEQIDHNLEMIATEDEDFIKLFQEGLIPKNALLDLLTGKR